MLPRSGPALWHNVLVNTLEHHRVFRGEAYISVNTIMPVFATLTDNPVIIGPIPALVNAGWYTHSFYGLQGEPPERKLPYDAHERDGTCSASLFPLFALAIQHWRADRAGLSGNPDGLAVTAAGLTALPWQEVTARRSC